MESKAQQIGFALRGIKTEQFAVFEENYTPKNTVNLGTSLQFKLDVGNRYIGVFLTFQFEQEKKTFLKIEISCHFQINNEAWQDWAQENGLKLVVSKDFLLYLAMITTGTARGVLFAKTEATRFSTIIIPILNITDLIPDDIIFDLSEE